MRSRPGVVANVVLLLACLAVHAANGAIVLVDFGRHDGTNGHETIGADINGNIWNNFSPPVSGSSSAPVPNGAAITNLVTTSNIVTSIGVTMMGDFWASNGRLNGGLFSPNGPQTNLLGRLAVETATEDFFFIWLSQTTQQMIRISGLATNRTCNLRFFATREAAETRITRYVSGTNSVSVTTSGTDIGSNGIYDGNDDEVVGLYGLQSDTNGAIDLLVQLVRVSSPTSAFSKSRSSRKPPSSLSRKRPAYPPSPSPVARANFTRSSGPLPWRARLGRLGPTFSSQPLRPHCRTPELRMSAHDSIGP